MRLRLPCLIVRVLSQAHVIRWLLGHDPAERPTSKELLKCDCLLLPQIEDSELHEVLRSTIANPESTAYKSLIQTIFTQSAALPAADFAYDNDFYRVNSEFCLVMYLLLYAQFRTTQCKKSKVIFLPVRYSRPFSASLHVLSNNLFFGFCSYFVLAPITWNYFFLCLIIHNPRFIK